MSNYDSDMDLSGYDDDFAAAPDPTDNGGSDKIADGKYNVTVIKMICKRSKAGNPMLEWTLRIDGPTNVGRQLWRYNMLATQQNHTWLKGDLRTCGFTLAKLSDLPDRCEELVGLRLRVTKKTKGDFENIYINELLTDAAAQPETAAGDNGKGEMPPGVTHHNYPKDDPLPF